ncbi:hypothetical protein [Flavobacterium aquatile]|uniref:Uncharacterized protein n=1 Tax=Flavobacterium aquatile LMG 4008 = ATCC 11947 TaxID=1453498 RepID=A0A095SWN3_9FLAO|nr:hypothetical protein [Flavobacterium aquatile]KGD68769.1 hypothetical protein LG45_03745 [Flavobacterium aquatile LMG 4008 = ATCC 11947]OXA69188.1 hypothetical protein B0A61_01375 [Flavobacterium aquatile LMG 4008 = ATCC 11947]GEC79061.1 hypothetical protein FAQ01_19310 [Flavobacterium aquatile]
MSTESQNNSDNQEIDLSQISKKIGGFFEDISTSIFKGILFLKRNILIIGGLFVLGVVLGIYLDKTSKSYDHQVIVTPNFGSTDYLYSKIELINSKIGEQDTLFLKNVLGLKEPKKFKRIAIEPINDVYKFIENREQNFEFIKLLAEDGDIKKIITEKVTSKNYPFHAISFSTSKLASEKNTVEPILKYLNDSDYYSKIQKEYINNIKVKIVENDSIISQINGFLNTLSNEGNKSQSNDNLVYINENTQLNDVIKTKEELVSEQGNRRIELINTDKIIKQISVTLNVKNIKSINGKLKLVLPFLFLFIFIGITIFRSFYRRQLAKSKLQ